MTHEWPWMGALGTSLVPALGHLYHFILAVNISSGMGLRESTLGRLRGLFLAALVGTAAWMLCAHLEAPWWTWSWPARAYALLCAVSGGLIWPGTSLAVNMRRRPPGVIGQTEHLDLAQEQGADPLIGRGRAAWLLRVPGNESFRLRRREWEVRLAGLPERLDGLKIVQLSDLHFAPWFDRSFFERVVAACRDWEADLVAVTGDLIDHDDVLPWVEHVLQPLEARLGKYAILGNHDAEHHPEAILERVEQAGFEPLDGSWITIDADGARIALGGTSAPWGPPLASAPPSGADFRILLSHSPDQFRRARGWGVDLMLSGHNHGGQVRLPAVGPVFMPSVYSRRFDRGFFRAGRTLMYVTEGVAGKVPFRYGCAPEVCRFVLRCETQPG